MKFQNVITSKTVKEDWRVYGKFPEIKVKVYLIILKFSLNQAYRDLMEPLHDNFH